MVKRKKNILIVEDNEFYMNLISNALEKVPCINIYKAANSAEAYKCAMETTVDVFVVDVILDTSVSGDVSGIKYVERIRTIDKYKFTPIIITSSLEDPKLHSYNYLHCYRYFEKTYDIRELLNTILETLEYKTPEEENKIIYYKREGILFAVNVNDIIYVENLSKYIEYHCVDGVHKAPYKSCKKILEEIQSTDFIQCSKHNVVNKQYILSVDLINRYITLKNDYGMLEIGPKMKKDFLKKLRNE